MNLLYLVTESDSDAIFYALYARRFTGLEFELISLRNRKGDGIAAVQKQMRIAVQIARQSAGGEEPVFFLAAVDNDRSPHVENNGLQRSRLSAVERSRVPRLNWMTTTVETALGTNRATWPLKVALAVPVEMLEAWIVRSCRENEPQPTRYFSRADSQSAREYYSPSDPPNQWKDLAEEEETASGCANKLDFYNRVVQNLDASALAARSESFRLFKEWMDQWPNSF